MLLHKTINCMYKTAHGEYFHTAKDAKSKQLVISARVWGNSDFVNINCKTIQQMKSIVVKLENLNTSLTAEFLTDLGFK